VNLPGPDVTVEVRRALVGEGLDRLPERAGQVLGHALGEAEPLAGAGEGSLGGEDRDAELGGAGSNSPRGRESQGDEHHQQQAGHGYFSSP
jgi:hypothetical protein